MLDDNQIDGWLNELPEIISVEQRNPPEGGLLFEYEPNCQAAWDIACCIDGLIHELIIVLYESFPAGMPRVYVRNPEDYGLLSHSNCRGCLCFFDHPVGAFFDTKRPQDILYSAFYAATELLSKNLGADNYNALLDEFDGSWRWLSNKHSLAWLPTPSEHPEKFHCRTVAKLNTSIVYTGDFPEYGFVQHFTDEPPRTAWYFPLRAPVLPPDSKAVSAKYVRDLFEHIQGDMDSFNKWMDDNRYRLAPPRMSVAPGRKKKKVRKPRRNKSQSQDYTFLFSTPRPSGGRALFGVRINGRLKENFFQDDTEKAWDIVPLDVVHHYREYMTERGGADMILTSKSVAVVGCGAVGSKVVEKLVMMGVGHLILVDDDYLSNENIFRHHLGSQYIPLPKVDGLTRALKSDYPGVSLVPRDMTREQWVENHPEEVEQVDLLIDATGEFTGMRAFNEMRFKYDLPPTIFSWVEACGVGGHAVLVGGEQAGCFNCLVFDSAKGPHMSCHYLKPFQQVTKDLLGCGSFTPFSALDADKTATMACELALETMKSEDQVPSIYSSWRGRPDTAVQNGFEFNASFEATPLHSVQEHRNFGRRTCTVCGDS